MKFLLKLFRENLLPIITICLGTLFQLWFLASHDILFLIKNTLPDDAFYYFQPARNIVNGLGSTLDSVNITNGYHPLWMLVILPIFKHFSVGGTNDVAPIYASLSVAILFSFITALVLLLILTRFTQNKKIISFALFAYLFNPYVLYNVLNGLETSLVLMLMSLFTYQLIRVEERLSIGNLILLGVFGGLLALARLDMVLVVAIGNLFILQNFGKDNFKKALNCFFVSGITSAIIFLIWVIYNFNKFGMLLTSASITSTFVNHRLTYSDNGGESIKVFIKTIPYMLERATQQLLSNTGAPILILLFYGVGLYFLLRQLSHIDFKSYKSFNISPVVFVSLGLFGVMCVSAGLRWTFRDWYFIPLLIPLSVFLVWTIQKLWLEFQMNFKSKLVQNLIFIFLICSFSFSFFVSWNNNLEGIQTLQGIIYTASQWQNYNLPKGSHIGVFNCGIQAYFSTHRVTNLDGLINNNASKAMLNNTLWDYITNVEHIDYISDFDSYMTYRYKDSFGTSTEAMYSHLEKVKTFSGPKDLNVYKVKY